MVQIDENYYVRTPYATIKANGTPSFSKDIAYIKYAEKTVALAPEQML